MCVTDSVFSSCHQLQDRINARLSSTSSLTTSVTSSTSDTSTDSRPGDRYQLSMCGPSLCLLWLISTGVVGRPQFWSTIDVVVTRALATFPVVCVFLTTKYRSGYTLKLLVSWWVPCWNVSPSLALTDWDVKFCWCRCRDKCICLHCFDGVPHHFGSVKRILNSINFWNVMISALSHDWLSTSSSHKWWRCQITQQL